ncbi:MAG: hypothetical protein J4N29_05825 [Chloroflexi bacterium]|nr:hypothetical protein [Chloroflexota bacterium]
MAGEGAGAGRRGLAGLALALGVVALAGCAVGAKAGEPGLPAGFAAHDMPGVDANAYVYVNAGEPARVPLGAFGATDLVAGAGVVSIEVVVDDPDRDFAARAELVDEATARIVAEAALSVASADAARWVQADGPIVAFGHSEGPWGDTIREAWAVGSRVTIEERYPDVWEAIRLLPEDAPGRSVAVGFARNAPDLLDATLEAIGFSLPGLASALALIRADVIVFGVYAADPSRLPERLDREALRGSGIGVLGVAQAGYPGFVVGFLFDQFAERANLEETEVGGTTALYRVVDGDVHLMVKAYGSSIFLAAAPTRAEVEALVLAVVRSQESRS